MSEGKSSDNELILALVEGDNAAMSELVERWERPLYSFIFRYIQNEQYTRDLVQEVFVRVYTKREKFNPEYTLSSWIFTIAANLCKNQARWFRRHPEVSLERECSPAGADSDEAISARNNIASGESTPLDQLSNTEELDLLKTAVMELPHDLKTAMLLHHYEGLSYKEVSLVVGCSPRGVETRLYRARKLLKQRMTLIWQADEAALESSHCHATPGVAV